MTAAFRARRSLVGMVLAALVTGSIAVPGEIRAADPLITAYVLDSEPGDSIGLGQLYGAEPATVSGSSRAAGPPAASYVQLDVGFLASFRGPADAPLAIGAYENAARATFAGASPGLEVYGLGRGCNTISGRFVVLEAPAFEADGTSLHSFAVDFEQHCEGGGPAMFGSIRLNSSIPIRLVRITPPTFEALTVGATGPTVPVTVTNPTQTAITPGPASLGGANPGDFLVVSDGCSGLTLAPSATCQLGLAFAPTATLSRSARLVVPDAAGTTLRRLAISGQGLSPLLGNPSSVVLDSLPADWVGAGELVRAVDAVVTGSGAISDVHFAWNGWMFELAAADGAPITAGVYTGAQRAPFRQAGHPGLDVYAPGRGCNTVAGSFTVLEPPVFDTDGATLLQFAADFVQLCGEDPAQALHGAIRFHSTVPVKMLRVTGPTAFAAQEVATTSAPASYAATNVGTVPATVGAISVSGTDVGAFAVADGGCIGAALAVGGTCSFAATFTPAVVGTATATLMTTDDTDLGGRSFPVTGTGVAAPPPDTSVDATGVGVTPTAFYPYVDRYLDTASIRGTLGEAASVSISIYSVATGKRVRLVSLGTRTGAYAWPWNGRSASGTAQPAGRYRVVQTLRDAAGNTTTITTSVTVSWRRVAWRTVTLSKAGRSAAAGGAAGGGWYRLTSSSYANGARIYSGSDYAALGYAFSIPSALVYRSFSWQVVGRSTNGRRAVIGLQDYRIGSGWYVGNFAPLAATGTGYGTHRIAVSPTGHRNGRTVRGIVAVAYGAGAAGFDIQAVKLVVTYAVWP